jgi:hypothetical protein
VPPPEFVTPLENDEERLDAAHRESPMRYRAYDNIIGVGEHVLGLAARNLVEEHLQAVKKILRYIIGTLQYGLRYGRWTGTTRLVGYCDSDLADDIDTRKSTTGALFFLDKCLVSWQSLKQRVVALSSCEAEYTSYLDGLAAR